MGDFFDTAPRPSITWYPTVCPHCGRDRYRVGENGVEPVPRHVWSGLVACHPGQS